MFTLFAILALLRGWYRTAERHSETGKHHCNTVRDGKMNKWVGELSEGLATRLQYYKTHDARLYKLATGSVGRMA